MTIMYFSSFCQARYCDDPEQAEVFYHHALVLVPSNGMENFKFWTHIFHFNSISERHDSLVVSVLDSIPVSPLQVQALAGSLCFVLV